ncbi:MAG: DUF3800 domain-containing protein [Candidatus Binatus sp.]
MLTVKPDSRQNLANVRDQRQSASDKLCLPPCEDEHLTHGDDAPCIQIRKFVSGMAPTRRDGRILVILHQLVVDESGYGQTGPRDCFIFAGFFGTVRKWENHAHKWFDLLNQAPALSAKSFKRLLRKERNSERVLGFVGALKECELFRISVCIPRKAYENAILAEIPKFRKLGLSEDAIWIVRNEYYFAFFCIIDSILIPMELAADKSDKLQVIYDENIHERGKLKSGYREFLVSMPEDAARLKGEPIGDTDDDVLGLQSADLYAWHLHRDLVEKEHGREHRDSVWEALKTIKEYPGSFVLTESDLRKMARWDALEHILAPKR